MRFVLPAALLEELRRRRAAQRNGADPSPAVEPTHRAFGIADEPRPGTDPLQREVEDAHDAFLLDPGMGPMMYLTADGRVLADGRTWTDGGPLREVAEDAAIAAIVVGARKSGLDMLLSLLPPCPSDARVCETCQGRRWMTVPLTLVCGQCSGRGWR
jgi:hypothetical protein